MWQKNCKKLHPAFKDASSTLFNCERGLWQTEEELQKVHYHQLFLKKELWGTAENNLRFPLTKSPYRTTARLEREAEGVTLGKRFLLNFPWRLFQLGDRKLDSKHACGIMNTGETANSPKKDFKNVLALPWWAKSRKPNVCYPNEVVRTPWERLQLSQWPQIQMFVLNVLSLS